ncbi:putative zinc binding protein [Pseudonocardia sediminis]|uniref:Putative zinc binding protein n=1 Tax=Pseudonocardia sediminis TaxID=1397368 RepID=A0A4Q7V8R1_PSEST|nr:class I SAM-dependent methyltransferase [Pseudonocardia sediminis]RZT89199.1 putative zinc binding protein [Pseudonocardia sediminis]
MPVPTATQCRSCGDSDGEVVLDLGRQPSWDRMPWADVPLPDPEFDLQMWFCRSCSLAQLRCDADGVDEMFAVEPRAVAEQSDRSIARLDAEGLVGPGRTVAEFGSPHGESWLARLAGRGMDALGDGDADRPADLVVDFYGLLHEPDQEAALSARVAALAPGGTLAMQMLSLGTVLVERQWYDLRHGHHAYWSLPALDAALRRHGLGVHRVFWYPMSGGTVLVTARRDPEPDAATLRLIEAERAAGVTDAAALRGLQRAAADAHELRDWLVAEHDAGRTVAAYGAASRSVPLICHAGLHSGLLRMVGDASPTKQGRRMPGTDIPVVTPDELVAARPDRVLLFLAELADEVRDSVPGIESAGGQWVLLDPAPRVLELSPAS